MNLVCTSIVAVLPNNNKLSEVLSSKSVNVNDFFYSSNTSFSWVSNTLDNNSAADSLYLFSYIWLSIVFFLVYLNVGLATLLFLLEAGLLSPIAAMSLLNALPLSSILFFLNAITMESVVGVIVVLSYSKDWAVRDFTKYEVLESNLSSAFLSNKKTHSWSDNFFFYLTMFWWSTKYQIRYFNLFLKILVTALSTELLYRQLNLSWVFEYILKFPVPVYSSYPNDIENIFFKLDNSFKQNKNYPNLAQKSPLVKKNFEFIYGGGLHYIEFFNQSYDLKENVFSVWKFNNFNFFKLIKNKTTTNMPVRYYSIENKKYTQINNPNNLLSNLSILSGLYFDESAIKKNSTFHSNFYKNTEKPKYGRYNNNVSVSNFNKNLSTVSTYDLLDHERRTRLVVNYTNHTPIKNVTKKTKDFNIFKFGNYNSLLGRSIRNFSSVTSIGNSLENNLALSLNIYGKTGLATNYIKKGKLLVGESTAKVSDYWSLNNIEFAKIKSYIFNKKDTTSLIIKSSVLDYQNRYFFSINKRILFSNKIYSKFSNKKAYTINTINNIIPINFKKIKIEKNSYSQPRHLVPYFYLKNKMTLTGTGMTNQITQYTDQISMSFNYILGNSEWGSKNKFSIFDLKSKNLPWFDYPTDDEYFIDKSSEILFNNALSWSDIKSFEKTISNFEIISEKKDKSDFSLHNEYKILKKRTGFSKSKIKSKKSKFFVKSGLKRKELGSRWKQKKKIWNIKLNWNYNGDLEKLYSFQNKNINSFFLENKTYIKRFGNLQNNLPVLEYRQLSKFSTTNQNNFTVSINSKQSQDFGTFEVDVGNLDRFFTSISKIDYKDNNKGIANKRIFSFKDSQYSHKRYSGLGVIGKQFHKINEYETQSTGLGVDNHVGYSEHLFPKSDKKINRLSMDNTEEHSGLPAYESGGEFFNKLKIFWDNNSFSSFNYEKYENKEVVSSRFLNTFKKIIKYRNNRTTGDLNRFERVSVSNPSILKILQNNNRMLILNKSFNKITDNFNSEMYNMLGGVGDKILIMEDREVANLYTRSGYKKPHSVYGILWDEYLKNTYGFSLNFLNLNSKLPDNENILKKKNSNLSIWNKNFSKNIENYLNITNKQTGLTQDSNLASEITSRFLPKIGFYKLVNCDTNLGFKRDYLLKKNRKYIKNLKVNNNSSNFRDKKKIKKYFKKVILKTTVEKANLTKKSIGYLKKFSETPTGLKYDNINIGQKLPYIKKNVASINEVFYSKHNMPEANSWLLPKNKADSLTNRLLTSKKSKIKFLLTDDNSFKKKNYQKLLMRLSSYGNKTFLDFKGKGRLKSGNVDPKNYKPVFLFSDKNTSNYSVSNINENTKRSLEATRPVKSSEFLKRFEKINRTTINLFKKNRTKRFKNFNLMFRSSLLNSNIGGGALFFNYTGYSKIDNDLLFKGGFSVRSNKNFDNYSIFESRPVKQIRSFENKNFYQIHNNRIANYSNYRNLNSSKSRINEMWNRPGLIKNYRVDLNHFESTMNRDNYSSSLKSENYKLKNIDKRLILGFEDNQFMSIFSKKKINIFLSKTRKNSEFSEFYSSKVKFNEIGFIKNKKFSGLVDYTTGFTENFNEAFQHTNKNREDLKVFLKKKNVYYRFFGRKAFFYTNEILLGSVSIKIHKDIIKFKDFPRIKINRIVDYSKLILHKSIGFFLNMPQVVIVFYVSTIVLSYLILREVVRRTTYIIKSMYSKLIFIIKTNSNREVYFKNKIDQEWFVFFYTFLINNYKKPKL